MKTTKFNFFIIVPLVLIASIIITIFFASNNGCVSDKQVKKYLAQVSEYSYEYQVEPELVFAVIKVESNFDEQAVSNRGAIGLMQIMPTTAAYIAQKIGYSAEINLKNADCNIALGCAYLSYLKQKFNTEKEFLCAYNAGEGIVSKWLENSEYSLDGKTLNKIAYVETQNYVKKVLAYKQKYKKFLLDINYYEK